MDETQTPPRGGGAGTDPTRRSDFPRRRFGGLLAAAAALWPPGGARAQPAPVQPSRGTGGARPPEAGAIQIASGGRTGTYVRIAEDLSSVLEGTDSMVLPVLTRGSVHNIGLLLGTRGIGAACVQHDALVELYRRAPDPVARSVQYALKLYDEEVHVLAAREIADVGQLAGKRVNVDRPDSGTALTAAALFRTLGLAVEAVHDDQATALARLARGEIAALVFVAGKPVDLLSRLGPAEAAGLRLLPLPLNAALLDVYAPARIEPADYPALTVGGDGIDTLSVATVLAVYAWPPGTEHHANLVKFLVAAFDRLPELGRPRSRFHPKWHDVSARSVVPGLLPFAPARALSQARGA